MLAANATFLLIWAPVRMPLMRLGAGNSKSVNSPCACRGSGMGTISVWILPPPLVISSYIFCFVYLYASVASSTMGLFSY